MNEILNTLIGLWKYDLHVFSQPWMYWSLLIPVSCYLVFFFVKWVVITAPLWLPVVIMSKGVTLVRFNFKQNGKKQ